MQAIRVSQFGPPETMVLAEHTLRPIAAREVLVELKAAGVNPVDTYIRAGTYAVQPGLPYTPGHDGAGVVGAIGAAVTSVRVGERVALAGSLTGTYAEQAIAMPSQLIVLPDHTSFAQGAALGIPFATAYRALFQVGAAKSHETVLIHGASGGVGTAAVQFARNAGMRIIASAGTQAGRNMLAGLGAHLVLDHQAPDRVHAIETFTRGRGPDLILEMLANINLPFDTQCVSSQGRIVVVGCRDSVEFNPRQLMVKEAVLRGVMLTQATDGEKNALYAAIHRGLEQRTLEPIIGGTLALHQAAQAHRRVLQEAHHGKLVLTCP